MYAIHSRSTDKSPVVFHISNGYCSAAGLISYLANTGMPIGRLVLRETAASAMLREVERAAVMVVGDQVLDEPNLFGLLCRRQSMAGGDQLVVVMTARRLDFHQRLRLTELGNVRIFSVTDEMKLVLDLIRYWKQSRSTNGYRVLLVEDSRTDAYLATKYLEQVGIEVMHLRSAEHVLEALSDFEPDLIVSDLHMADCDGAQMARVIRQDREATLPIIFLSSESDSARQLTALAAGADGFIRKPLLKEPFIQVIQSTIRRSVALERRMRSDPLTNLLNRGQFMSTMTRQASRGGECAMVIIDIDHFKTVNDTYGHPAGDQVICGLAQVLQEGVRATDSIGRIGGEEIAVLMPDCSMANAAMVVDRLRKAFEAVVFTTDQGERFGCTFSAGISPLTPNWQAAYGSADEALYRAKKMGRNRLMVCPVDGRAAVRP